MLSGNCNAPPEQLAEQHPVVGRHVGPNNNFRKAGEIISQGCDNFSSAGRQVSTRPERIELLGGQGKKGHYVLLVPSGKRSRLDVIEYRIEPRVPILWDQGKR